MSGYIRSWADYITGQASHAAKTTEKEAGAVGDRAKQAWTDFQHLPIGGYMCAVCMPACLPGDMLFGSPEGPALTVLGLGLLSQSYW